MNLKLVDGDIGLEETAKRVVSAAIQNFETVRSRISTCRQGIKMLAEVFQS